MQYRTIAFSGTSLTSGVTACGWQVDVIKRLQVGRTVEVRGYNLGAPGRRSQDGVNDVGRLAALRPDIAVFEYAMNDAYLPNNVTAATLTTNLGLMIDATLAQNPSCKIFLMTMNPSGSPGTATVPNLPAYYQAVRDVAGAKGVGLIDNTPLYPTITTANTANGGDGIHPVASVVQSVVVPNVTACLSPYI